LGSLASLLSFGRARIHISSSHSFSPCLLSILWPTSNSVTNPYERLAILLGRVLDDVRIHVNFALREKGDNCAASVLELSKTLRSTDLAADCNTRVVDDATDQHGADCDDSDAAIGVGAFDDHNGAPVLAEDVERSRLGWISSVHVVEFGKRLDLPH